MDSKVLEKLSSYFYDILKGRKEVIVEVPSFLSQLITANDIIFYLRDGNKLVGIKSGITVELNEKSILQLVVENQTSKLVNFVTLNENYNPSIDNPKNLPVKHILAVPIIDNKEVIGVIEAFITDNGFHQFISQDIEILESLNKFFVGLIEVYLSEDKDKIIREVKHDVKNIINGLVSSFEFLKIENKDSKINKLVNVAINNSKLVIDLIELLSKDDYKLEISEDNLLEHFTSLSYLYCDRALKKNVEFYTYFDMPKKVKTDIGKVRQIVLNLVGNAVKFTNSGKVEFEARVKDNQLYLRVEDTGIGIKKENLSNIFKPYMRESDVKNIEGTGLGLSIVKKYVDLLGGRIEVESEKGRGTKFEVFIPVEAREPIKLGYKKILVLFEKDDKLANYIKRFLEPYGVKVDITHKCQIGNYDFAIYIDKECEYQIENRIFVSVTKEPKKSYNSVYSDCMIRSGFLLDFCENEEKAEFSGKVLVADDNKINCDLLVYILEKVGLEVVNAHDGEEALELFNKNPDIKLAIVDIDMPKINGMEFSKKINRKVPVIAFSGIDKKDCEKIVPLYFDDCLLKPLSLEDVFKLLKKYL